MPKSKSTPRRVAVQRERENIAVRRPDLIDLLEPEMLSLEAMADQLDFWQYEIADDVADLPSFNPQLREYQTSLREVRRALTTIPPDEDAGTDWKAEAEKYANAGNA